MIAREMRAWAYRLNQAAGWDASAHQYECWAASWGFDPYLARRLAEEAVAMQPADELEGVLA